MRVERYLSRYYPKKYYHYVITLNIPGISNLVNIIKEKYFKIRYRKVLEELHKNSDIPTQKQELAEYLITQQRRQELLELQQQTIKKGWPQ